MRILMVAPEQIPVPGSGSVEICMLAIAKQLAKKHKVTIVSRRASGLEKKSQMGNLTIVRVRTGSPKTYIKSVLKYMKDHHYDWIQVDNRPFYMAKVKSAFPKTPVSLFLHSLTFVPKKKAIAHCLKKADLIVANSSSLKDKLSHMFSKQKHKIKKVYLGVDPNRFTKVSTEERKRSKQKYKLGGAYTVLFAGRVIPRKGVPVLIDAVRKVRKKQDHVHLVIAGRGNQLYMSKLRGYARKLKVPVTYLGKIPHRKIHKAYRLADCFVCPSQKHEAFGLVNVEAMASGVPVVASDIGGIKEIVEHGRNGYLVQSYRNPSSFAKYILKLAKNPALRKEMGKKGRKTVLKHFTWERTAAKLSKLYRR